MHRTHACVPCAAGAGPARCARLSPRGALRILPSEAALPADSLPMLAPSLELARRLEAVDVRLGHALVAAFQALYPREFAGWWELGGGALHAVGGRAPIARAAGLGLDGKLPERDLEQLVELLEIHRRAAEVQLCPFADASLAARLAARGFVPAGSEIVMAREVEAADRNAVAPRSFSIHGMHPREAELWARTVASGYAAGGAEPEPGPGALDTLLARAASDGFLGFLVRLGNAVVAAGGMCCAGDVATLLRQATYAPFRRRGVQRALIAHALAVAAERGMSLVTLRAREDTCSLRNFEVAGFSRLWSNAVLARPAPDPLKA